jgi:hypothetical protein
LVRHSPWDVSSDVAMLVVRGRPILLPCMSLVVLMNESRLYWRDRTTTPVIASAEYRRIHFSQPLPSPSTLTASISVHDDHPIAKISSSFPCPKGSRWRIEIVIPVHRFPNLDQTLGQIVHNSTTQLEVYQTNGQSKQFRVQRPSPDLLA